MSTPRPADNPYLRTKVMTASPAELRMMLLDGALRFLRQGIAGLEGGDHEAAYDGVSQCQAILIELLSALDPERAPEIATNLSGLYTFMYTRLVEGLSDREVEKLHEVLGLLEYERETWALVMKELESGSGGGDAPATALSA